MHDERGADEARATRTQDESAGAWDGAPRFALRTLVAAGLLALAEVGWLLELEYRLSAARVVQVLAALVLVAASMEALLLIAGGVARGVGAARARVVGIVVCAPGIVLATRSLFSGKFIADVPGVVAIQFGFGLALAATIWAAMAVFPRAARSGGGLVTLVALGVFAAASWADTHLFVGLYPAFHALLTAAVLVTAALVARRFVSADSQVPAVVGAAAALLVVASPPIMTHGWRTLDAVSLASYSNGLVPRIRHGVVAVSRWGRAPAPSRGDRPSEPIAAAPEMPEVAPPPNLLEDGQALDSARWMRGGRSAHVVTDDDFAPDGTRTAELVRFADGISTLVQAGSMPAAGETFSAAIWVRRKSGPPDARVELLLMDGRTGRVARTHAVPSDEWTRLELRHTFGLDDTVGDVTFRFGNDHESPAPLEVWAWGAELSTAELVPTIVAGALPERSAWPSLPEPDPDVYRFVPSGGLASERVRARTRNVLFVVVDALRDDHVGPPDEGESLTPFLDVLAEEGVRFVHAYAAGDQTGRSMPTLMTSLPKLVVDDLSSFDVTLTTWLDVLAEEGFATFANGNCDYVTRKWSNIALRPSYGARETLPSDGRTAPLVDEIMEFVTRERGRRFAVYTHWMDTHIAAGRGMAETYRDKVRDADDRLRNLVGRLRRVGLYEETLLVVTADHGYSLGEGHRYLGSQGFGERLLHVPLLMHIPGSELTGARVSVPVSACDVAPTILDCLAPGARVPAAGASLLSLLHDPGDPRMHGGDEVFVSDGRRHMLRRGFHKLVWDESADAALVFHLGRDPEEAAPLDEPELADEMRQGVLARLDHMQHGSAAVIAAQRRDMDGRVLRLLVDPDLTSARVAAVLPDFWSWTSATRRKVLQTIHVRGLNELRDALDALARPSGSVDDELLLLLRARTGSAAAWHQLSGGWRELTGEGRRWFAELLGAMPAARVAPLVDDLVEEVQRLAQAEPALGTADERFVTATVFGLCRLFGRQAPLEVKRQLARGFNLYERPRPQYLTSILDRPRFGHEALLDAVRGVVTDEHLHVLDELRRTDDACRAIVQACRQLGTPASRRYLIDRLRAEPDRRRVATMLPHLRTFDDVAFVEEVDAVVRDRFPDLDGVGGSAASVR